MDAKKPTPRKENVKPRCVVYHATAASMSSTMYLTLTVSAGMTAP
jgi:hypothetical protein